LQPVDDDVFIRFRHRDRGHVLAACVGRVGQTIASSAADRRYETFVQSAPECVDIAVFGTVHPMSHLQLFSFDGRSAEPVPDPLQTARCLRTLGVESGRWSLRSDPISSVPQLTYARDLLALQRRFGSARVERILLWAGRGSAVEPSGEHEHTEPELRVVLQGRLHYVLRVSQAWISLRVAAGEWVLLPAGLAHAVMAVGEPRLEMLRLHGLTSERRNVDVLAA
jgi:mannose-6-phosphate isomerase-like protein (cupin superfamily)